MKVLKALLAVFTTLAVALTAARMPAELPLMRKNVRLAPYTRAARSWAALRIPSA